MTLRARIAAVASLAVAVAVVAAAVTGYLAIRSELFSEIDQTLNDRARPLLSLPGLPGGPGGPRGDRPNAGASGGPPRPTRGAPGPPPRGGPGGVRRSDPGGDLGAAAAASTAPFGGAAGHVQFVSPNGQVSEPADESSTPLIPADASARAIAASGNGRHVADVHIRGVHVRVLTLGRGQGGALQVARPLNEVDRELGKVLVILLVVGVSGIVLAAVLGTLVARTALRPIDRFTRRTERLTTELDLSQRLDVEGRDELARLARSFNTTLDALERSIDAQRHLVADASHELRTPMASLRANIQTLEHADRLPEADRASLRADIIEELDELTALVGDVVELARGAKPGAVADYVRLDEIAQAAVERARRRADELTFDVRLTPSVVKGDPDRINRAVSNLVDNARKWSPPGAAIEIVCNEGILTVRDHGPGFDEDDLPYVFDRFYRAGNARKMSGSGLGLAIVRQAAEAHGGYVRAANAPGGGARLEVSFGPVVKEDPAAQPDALASPSS